MAIECMCILRGGLLLGKWALITIRMSQRCPVGGCMFSAWAVKKKVVKIAALLIINPRWAWGWGHGNGVGYWNVWVVPVLHKYDHMVSGLYHRSHQNQSHRSRVHVALCSLMNKRHFLGERCPPLPGPAFDQQ